MSDATTVMPVSDLPANPEISMFRLFTDADLTVQAVMLILIAASIFSWAIMISRYFLFKKLTAKADHFEDLFWSGTSLDKIYSQVDHDDPDPLSAVFISAMREWDYTKSSKLSLDQRISLQQRLERIMNVTIDRETENLEGPIHYLASVGSVAPFVGLLGTVWGIMTSFQSIAASQSTNLAVVAPGIAEALFATAMGLVAAIPAVLGYNRLSGMVNKLAARMTNFVDEFVTIVARQFDDKVG